VDMPVENGFVGMVDRCEFDEWLRVRAEEAGATRLTGRCTGFATLDDGTAELTWDGGEALRARMVIAADGARSELARQAIPSQAHPRCVFAYHEIVETPPGHDGTRCDVVYRGTHSPDFYAWVFPHGETAASAPAVPRRASACARRSAGCAPRPGWPRPAPSAAKAPPSR
jgi:geranylgeranyl reductase